MGQYDNFDGGVETPGAMYEKAGSLAWHSASKTFNLASATDASNAFLSIETRTDDPVTPAVGRVWLRVDL